MKTSRGEGKKQGYRQDGNPALGRVGQRGSDWESKGSKLRWGSQSGVRGPYTPAAAREKITQTVIEEKDEDVSRCWKGWRQ